jgi:hypothetical protein
MSSSHAKDDSFSNLPAFSTLHSAVGDIPNPTSGVVIGDSVSSAIDDFPDNTVGADASTLPIISGIPSFETDSSLSALSVEDTLIDQLEETMTPEVIPGPCTEGPQAHDSGKKTMTTSAEAGLIVSPKRKRNAYPAVEVVIEKLGAKPLVIEKPHAKPRSKPHAKPHKRQKFDADLRPPASAHLPRSINRSNVPAENSILAVNLPIKVNDLRPNLRPSQSFHNTLINENDAEGVPPLSPMSKTSMLQPHDKGLHMKLFGIVSTEAPWEYIFRTSERVVG